MQTAKARQTGQRAGKPGNGRRSQQMGEFTDKADAEHIRLADPNLGRLEIKLENGKLTLSIINCLSAEPSVIFAPETTTMGIEFSICIGVYDVYSY